MKAIPANGRSQSQTPAGERQAGEPGRPRGPGHRGHAEIAGGAGGCVQLCSVHWDSPHYSTPRARNPGPDGGASISAYSTGLEQEQVKGAGSARRLELTPDRPLLRLKWATFSAPSAPFC